MGGFSRSRQRGKLLLVTSAASLALLSSEAAVAQSGTPAAAVADSEQLAEITVTARRREERLSDVPVSITLLTGNRLAKDGVTGLEALVSRAPTLVIQKGSIGPFSFMRGFGAGANLAFEQAVGKLVDGVSYGRDQDNRLPLFDIERVEVLKGPQVLLFGNSSTAGALNITTRKPGDTFTADASVGYEFNRHELVAQGGVTTPLSDKASLRVAGFYENLDKGQIYNVTRDVHESTYRNMAGRATLKLEPTENLEILLKADLAHLRTDGQAGEYVAQPFSPAAAVSETKLDNRIARNSNTAPIFGTDYFEMDMKTFQGDINLEAVGGTLSSTTAYRTADYSWSASSETIALTNAYINSEYSQFSQELRYSATFDRLTVLTGGYFQSDELKPVQEIDFNLPGLPIALISNFREKSRILSGFGELNYKLTPEFTIAIGARYSSVRKTAVQQVAAGNIVPGKNASTSRSTVLDAINPALDPIFAALTGGNPPRTLSGLRRTENFFQPQVIAQYSFADRNMIYAKFVKGAKAGGFDPGYLGASRSDVYFGPEKAKSYELGVKGLLLGGSLDYAIALFQQDYTDLQLSQLRGLTTIVDNVGRARARGVEVETNWAPAPGLRLGFSGAYLDAEFRRYDRGPCDRATAAATPGGVACFRNLAGVQTPFSSKWTGAFSIDYKRPVNDEYSLGGNLTLTGRSAYFSSSNPEPLLRQNGYVQLAGYLDFGPTDGRWTLTLFGRNLTNKQYNEFGASMSGAAGGLFAYRSLGRQIGVRGSVKM